MSFHLLFGLATSGIGLQKNSRSWSKDGMSISDSGGAKIQSHDARDLVMGTFIGIGSNFQADLTMETFYVPEHKKKKNDCQQGPHNFWQRITLLICLNTITRKEVLNWSRCVPIWGGKRVKSICASSFFNSDVIHRHGRNALPRGITCLMYLACTHFLLPKLFNSFHYQYVWAAHHYMSISNMIFIYLFICL